MDIIDFLSHIAKLISRKISGSNTNKEKMNNGHKPLSTSQAKEALKEIKQSYAGKQGAINKKEDKKKPGGKAGETKTTGKKQQKAKSEPLPGEIASKEADKKPVNKESLLIGLEPVETPADEYGLSISTIGKDNLEGSDDELEGILEEIQHIIKEHEPRQSKEKKRSLERIIKETEEASSEPFAQRAEAIKEMFNELRKKPKAHMVYFVMYDIENNRVRTRISKYLEEKGLRRIQKSIFLGQTHQRDYEAIRKVLTEIQESYENSDSIIIVPVPEDLLKTMFLIGKEVDFELTLNRRNTVFL